MSEAKTPEAKLRLDKWLWYTRIIKSRTLAQKLIESGAVRVNGTKTTRADHRVSEGMVLTMNVHERVRIFKILALGTRRGPAPEAATLYEDMSPVLPPREKTFRPAAAAAREPGSGRPTKRERRLTDELNQRAKDSGNN